MYQIPMTVKWKLKLGIFQTSLFIAFGIMCFWIAIFAKQHHEFGASTPLSIPLKLAFIVMGIAGWGLAFCFSSLRSSLKQRKKPALILQEDGIIFCENKRHVAWEDITDFKTLYEGGRHASKHLQIYFNAEGEIRYMDWDASVLDIHLYKFVDFLKQERQKRVTDNNISPFDDLLE